jgi:low affinity Fe/Cu permease
MNKIRMFFASVPIKIREFSVCYDINIRLSITILWFMCVAFVYNDRWICQNYILILILSKLYFDFDTKLVV